MALSKEPKTTKMLASMTPTKNEGGDDAEQRARDDVEDVGKRDDDEEQRQR
jgi:hypothetical protein